MSTSGPSSISSDYEYSPFDASLFYFFDADQLNGSTGWLAEANGSSYCGENATADGCGPLQQGLQYWTLCLVLFPVFTVFGNVLVCMSVYREKSLQHVTNYFIVSLAIADIMVAMLVMPFAVYVEVSQERKGHLRSKTGCYVSAESTSNSQFT